MALWRRLIAGSDWAHLSDVLSPAFFEIVPPRQLSVRAAELARHWFDHDGAKALATRLDQAAVGNGQAFRVSTATGSGSIIPFVGRPANRGRCRPARDGQALLEYFFFQIYQSDTVFLDLRAARFCQGAEPAVVFWPLPLWTRWQPDFVQGIRQLYDGFYGGSDALCAQAMRELGVSAAAEVFEREFGGTKKRASQYTVAGFEQTFHEVFVRCRDQKTAFHPDFVTLGIALATVYDHLETLGGTYDVESCFHRALGRCGLQAPPHDSATGIASRPPNG